MSKTELLIVQKACFCIRQFNKFLKDKNLRMAALEESSAESLIKIIETFNLDLANELFKTLRNFANYEYTAFWDNFF